MEETFIKIVNYLDELQNELNNEELSTEDILLIIIKNALLTDKYYHGSIIFTKENDNYRVSNIQKHSYAWCLQDEVIDMEYIIAKLADLNISYSLEYYPISNHKNDYELSFTISKLKKKTKIIR